MHNSEFDTLLDYYQSELSFLKNSGKDFAKKFPRIAEKLDLTSRISKDPHVERLIESTAFLTGKLQKQIDDLAPEIAYNLLNVICPVLTAQTPSATLAVFNVDYDALAKQGSFLVPKGTVLYSQDQVSDISCKFTTCNDLKLVPIEVLSCHIAAQENINAKVESQSPYYLKISLKAHAPINAGEELRFYLDSSENGSFNIIDNIFMTQSKAFISRDEEIISLGQASLIGFDDKESLFPYENSMSAGFRLAYEYFAFSDKFLGFSFVLGEPIREGGFEIYVPLFNCSQWQVNSLESINIYNNVTVAVNLFNKVSEPIDFDHKTIEYLVCPDRFRHAYEEIYTINKVVCVNKDGLEEEIAPYYSSKHQMDNADEGLFWSARRKPTYLVDSMGDDLWMSFVDINFSPKSLEEKTVYAHTLCTNRFLAQKMPRYAKMQVEIALPVNDIYCLNRPSAERSRCSSGEGLWRLVSLLSLNNTGLYAVDKTNVADYVKESLFIFSNFGEPTSLAEINGIKEVVLSDKIERIGQQVWKGFVHGVHAKLGIDNKEDVFGSKLIFSRIIQSLISSYLSINNFISLEYVDLNSIKRVSKQWDAITGTQQRI